LIRIWDLPTRVFHWALVLLIPAMWATHKLHLMEIHILLGQTLLFLMLFRLIWGLIGSSTARFAGFVRGPRAAYLYARARLAPAPGHNPLGGWSVVAMLLVLAVQIGLGLFASDEDGEHYGPLSHFVSYDSARTLAHRHETFFYILLALIALHLGAILYYWLVKRDNLVVPMVTGRRAATGSDEEMVGAPLWRFAVAAGLAGMLTLIVAALL
jgi:cytochrome b